MSLRQVINLGTENQPFAVTSRAKLINLISLFTFGISLLYTINYVFIIQNSLVAAINAAFTISYLITLTFSYFHQFSKAKIWFFCVLMLHLVVCTNIYVTKDSGFHLYFFLVPTGAFLLFEHKEVKPKVILSAIATLLFFYCENTMNTNPLILLSDKDNHLLYQSVILVNMVEVIVVMTLFSNQIEKNELKLTVQAKTDALTGVANRHYFFEKGNQLLRQSQQSNRTLCVTLLDLDHFKKINDSYGHKAGDVCLIQIANLIENNIREQDFFARIGGEEFVIILPDTTAQEANNLIERLRILIEEYPINVSDSNSIYCTASIGLACLEDNQQSLKDLLVLSDHALYQAKNNGRNRIILFDKQSA